jgi:hypothetical protein
METDCVLSKVEFFFYNTDEFLLQLVLANVSLVFLCLQENAQIVRKFKIAAEYFSCSCPGLSMSKLIPLL